MPQKLLKGGKLFKGGNYSLKDSNIEFFHQIYSLFWLLLRKNKCLKTIYFNLKGQTIELNGALLTIFICQIFVKRNFFYILEPKIFLHNFWAYEVAHPAFGDVKKGRTIQITIFCSYWNIEFHGFLFIKMVSWKLCLHSLSPISGALQIEYSATSTKKSPINLANHMYFNLAGHQTGTKYIYFLTFPACF